MKKELMLIAVFALMLSLPMAAAEIKIGKKAVNPVVIKEFSLPAEFDLSVTNDNPYYDTFTVDTLLPINLIPKNIGGISSGETETMRLEIYPSIETREKYSGNFAFEYFVKGERAALEKDNFLIEILPLKEVLEIEMPASLEKEDESLEIKMSLKRNISFETSVEISAELFDAEKTLTLSNEKSTISIPIDLKEKKAGIYDAVFSFEVGEEKAEITKDVVLGAVLEIEETREEEGYFLSKQVKVTKTNKGNSVAEASISMEKSMLASLFTTFDGSPKVKKEAGKYVYEWEKELNPGESFSATMKTNYYIPFGILLLVILGAVVLKIATTPQIKIKKKVVKVRTKSGMFAAKIILSVKNTGKTVGDVKVIDRLPAFTELLPEKFGVISPSEVKKKTVVWNFPLLEKGEEVMFSYIVFSKVEVFGKLEIPRTVVTFRDEKGIFKEAKSHLVHLLIEEEKKPEF